MDPFDLATDEAKMAFLGGALDDVLSDMWEVNKTLDKPEASECLSTVISRVDDCIDLLGTYINQDSVG